MEADVLQHVGGVLAAVAEVHAIELDLALQVGQHHARHHVLRLLLGFQVEHVAQPLHRHAGVVELAPQRHQPHQRRQHAAHERVEGDQLADGQFPLQHQRGAHPQDRDRRGGVQHLARQPHEDVERLRLVLLVQRLGVLAFPAQPHGRSMPMPLTVSAPPSVSIRYALASVDAANLARVALTFGVTSTVSAAIGITNAISSSVSLTL
jgi:hypothetical protein